MRIAPAQLEEYSTKVSLLASVAGPATRCMGAPFWRFAARFSCAAQRLAVLGAATAEPARRRVLATASNFILNEKRKELEEIGRLKRKEKVFELLI